MTEAESLEVNLKQLLRFFPFALAILVSNKSAVPYATMFPVSNDDMFNKLT